MSKRNILFLLLIAVGYFRPLSVFAQMKAHPLEQIDSLQKTSKRNMVVFIHTDWCRYCHSMKNTTLKNDSIISILNKEFWFAALNAEEKQDILFNGQIFKYKPTGENTGTHELAEQLAKVKGKISYPTLCILNANYEIIFQYNRFLSSAELLKVLNEVLKNSNGIRHTNIRT